MKTFAILTFLLLASALTGCNKDRDTKTAVDEREMRGSGGDERRPGGDERRPGADAREARSPAAGDDLDNRRAIERAYLDKLSVLDTRLDMIKPMTMSAPETVDLKVMISEAAKKRTFTAERIAELEAATGENWPMVRTTVIPAMADFENAIVTAEERSRAK